MNKRLQSEMQDCIKNPNENFVVSYANEKNPDINHWKAIIIGPVDTPYQNGKFTLDIIFPKEYPFQPPKVKFLTKILHPNVYSDGNICLDILASQWSPALAISKVLLSICSLLNDPNPNSPANGEIARLYTSNRDMYNKQVLENTQKYAK